MSLSPSASLPLLCFLLLVVTCSTMPQMDPVKTTQANCSAACDNRGVSENATVMESSRPRLAKEKATLQLKIRSVSDSHKLHDTVISTIQPNQADGGNSSTTASPSSQQPVTLDSQLPPLQTRIQPITPPLSKRLPVHVALNESVTPPEPYRNTEASSLLVMSDVRTESTTQTKVAQNETSSKPTTFTAVTTASSPVTKKTASPTARTTTVSAPITTTIKTTYLTARTTTASSPVTKKTARPTARTTTVSAPITTTIKTTYLTARTTTASSPGTFTKTARPTATTSSSVSTTTFIERSPSSPSSPPAAILQPEDSSTWMPPVQTRSLPTGPATKSVASTISPGSLNDLVASGTNLAVVEVAGAALTRQLVDTASLLAIVFFGLLFFLVTVAIFLTQAYESYRKKDYTQVDYLINGMYTDSDV